MAKEYLFNEELELALRELEKIEPESDLCNQKFELWNTITKKQQIKEEEEAALEASRK